MNDAIVSIIKHTPFPNVFVIENNKGDIIAIAAKIKEHDHDHGHGEYRVCMVGGAAHGKISYAADYDALNEKSYWIAKLHSETA